MKYTDYFLNTLKEAPSDAEIPSYSLSLRAGLIRKVASGIYSFLPLGLRVLRKIEKIVREEMNKTGAIEMLMPAIQPADLWIQSGRWFQYGPELFRLKDRNNRDFCLGPTHEELITNLAFQDIKSYKDLPVNLYQIQVKFRDEIRPRYGILRAREFIMKDAYSFSATEGELDVIYQKMYDCYSRILNRLSLKFFVVEADSGLIGGKYSHEFIILAHNGEDELAYCPNCGYSANYEMAKFCSQDVYQDEKKQDFLPLEEIYTPGITNIKALKDFLDVAPETIIKTMILEDQEKNYYAVLLPGNRELNIAKIEKQTSRTMELFKEDGENKNLIKGFLGPVNLDSKIKIYADNSLEGKINMITGANKKDYHLKNVNYLRDFQVDFWGDFSFPQENDLCLNCKNRLEFEKGIEIGHIFKLGTKYSEKMGATFLDAEGKQNPIIMGCYGIGVSRILSASIEQLFDDKGIVWPLSIAPFLVNLIAINMEDEEIAKSSERIYQTMVNEGIETIYDNRNVRAGVKFKDSDLMGIPIKVIVGKNFLEKSVLEIEMRKDSSKKLMDLNEALSFIKNYPHENTF